MRSLAIAKGATHPAIGERKRRWPLAAAHHLLLAHGQSVPALRQHVADGHVGIALNLFPVHFASSSDHDRLAAERLDGILNRTFLDPLIGRGYPTIVPYDRSVLEAFVREGDLNQIAVPLDFLGVNYYFRRVVRSNAIPEAENAPQTIGLRNETTQMGWEVYPEGLFEVFGRLGAEYPFSAYYITENGAAYPDSVNGEGRVQAHERVSYLRRHLAQVARIVDAGIPLRGYFVWSLLDNFEWSYGLQKRFGLIYVDFETGKRFPKASFDWYKDTIAQHTVH